MSALSSKRRTLRPDIEEKLKRVTIVEERLEAVTNDVESGEIDMAVPEEVWDDDSIVRHNAELKKEGERARRASDAPALKRVAQSNYSITTKRGR